MPWIRHGSASAGLSIPAAAACCCCRAARSGETVRRSALCSKTAAWQRNEGGFEATELGQQVLRTRKLPSAACPPHYCAVLAEHEARVLSDLPSSRLHSGMATRQWLACLPSSSPRLLVHSLLSLTRKRPQPGVTRLMWRLATRLGGRIRAGSVPTAALRSRPQRREELQRSRRDLLCVK